MNLIINQMEQFQVVHDTDGDSAFKRFSGTAIKENGFTIRVHAGQTERLSDISFARPVKNRCRDFPAKGLRGASEMDFQQLADIHSRRNTERIENDIKWSAVRQEGHVFF